MAAGGRPQRRLHPEHLRPDRHHRGAPGEVRARAEDDPQRARAPRGAQPAVPRPPQPEALHRCCPPRAPRCTNLVFRRCLEEGGERKLGYEPVLGLVGPRREAADDEDAGGAGGARRGAGAASRGAVAADGALAGRQGLGPVRGEFKCVQQSRRCDPSLLLCV